MARPRKLPLTARRADRHLLYEHAVQGVDIELDFFERVYRARHGRRPTTFREDFCGTASMACAFVRRGPERVAWGVDLDAPTLAYGDAHHRSALPPETAARLHLVHGNVLDPLPGSADIAAAMNFSYWVFKSRDLLRRYFERAREGLTDGGIFYMDLYGGTGAMGVIEERRNVNDARDRQGRPLQSYTYIWEQASFNPVTHDLACHIHFGFRDGTRLRRAFRYDWRLWTLPEVRELLLEAGFAAADVYMHGWTKDEEADAHYRKRVRFENTEGWIAYLAALA